MPNYFAHLTFGRQVRQALPEDLRRKLRAEGPAFELGCLGPDILFFYHLLAPSTARNEGHTMHRSSALPVFWRLRAAITAGTPMAAGYAAGFLCHLALDSTCHPYVNAKAAQGEISHLAMEAEFDRWLMRRAGLPSRGCAHMPAPMDRAVYRAAIL